jgi:hypothetical protein
MTEPTETTGERRALFEKWFDAQDWPENRYGANLERGYRESLTWQGWQGHAEAGSPVQPVGWVEQPRGISQWWLVDASGRILAEAGSDRLGGGAPFFAAINDKRSGLFTTLAAAKDEAERLYASPVPAPSVVPPESLQGRAEIVEAWNNLPEQLRCHPDLSALWRAIGKCDDTAPEHPAETSGKTHAGTAGAEARVSPEARALEFAEYMAKGAEQLLEAINDRFGAVEERDNFEGDENEDDIIAADQRIDRAEEEMNDFMRGLRADVYEFRKRAEKAKPNPHGLRATQETARQDEQQAGLCSGEVKR